ncbi:unnamed protein product [Owenia fusiformis]|uniref:Uncharacterized protein n=1 Tax=Owenia fusiformis TaxID=6347 RepID=A0A8J1TXX6_OWEFU|nr:unnamed protein product [Owenia fusiformis]
MLRLAGSSLHKAASEGNDMDLTKILKQMPPIEIEKSLNSLSEDSEGQNVTPLIIASKNGNEKIVKTLIKNSLVKINIDQVGCVKFDGYSIEGATSLWCASGAGHLEIVKLLVENGADVNHKTASNSTPLRAACFDGRVKIVQYLLKKKADLTITNNYKNTCLMISCYKGHRECVLELLKYKADPNLKAHCGANALLFAAEMGHLEIVKDLMKHKADMNVTNDYGVTPLMAAAESGKADIVDWFTNRKECSLLAKITAYELIGATYANDKANYNIEKAFDFFKLAMNKREENAAKLDTKKPIGKNPAYKNHIECTRMSELERIQGKEEKIQLEGLVIRERVFGQNYPDLPHLIVYRGAVHADRGEFDDCVLMWLYALKLRSHYGRTVNKDLLRFAQLFAQMHYTGHGVDFTHMMMVLEAGMKEFQLNQRKMKKGNKDEIKIQEMYYDCNITSMIYLLIIASKIKISEEEIDDVFYPFAYKLMKMNIRQPETGNTLLHLVCDQNTHIDGFHISDVVKFPNHIMTRMFCECGADVNAVNTDGDTPLHTIVRYDKPISDFHTLHAAIMSLIEYGAHVDMTNNLRKTAIDVSLTGVSEIIIKTSTSFTLKCLTAQVVKKKEISYVGQIPIELEEFIEMH